MSRKSAWSDIHDVLIMIAQYLPPHDSRQEYFLIGNFMCCRSQFGAHGITVMKEGSDFFTNACWDNTHPVHPFIETHGEGTAGRVMVTRTMLFSQPLFWKTNNAYPMFHEYWKRKKSGKGILDFFRTDMSLHDFAYYEREKEFVAVKMGDRDICAKLPDSLMGLTEVLGHTIPWAIDFEAKARDILEKSQLREFSAACKKIRVIN